MNHQRREVRSELTGLNQILKNKDGNFESGRLGLIAGNGRFPLLVLGEAQSRGLSVVVAAIREEADPLIETEIRGASSVHWVGVGQLSKLIRIFKKSGVHKVVMAGQVKHVQIFVTGNRSPAGILSALPDMKMLRLLSSLRRRDTQSLIEGVIGVLQSEGLELLDSTFLLSSLIPDPGLLSKRRLSNQEKHDIEYGWEVAKELSRLELGQTVVVKDGAVVAVEAMEGTDATIRRAAKLVDGSRLTVVKVGRPMQDMRYDVPVIGLDTLAVLKDCHVSALSIDSGQTLILDQEAFVQGANELKMSVVAQ